MQLYRFTFPKVHCVWTELKLSLMSFTIQSCSIFLWQQHRTQKAFPSLWINLVVKSYGARQFFNNLLKRCWSLSQKSPQMAHFITFHPLEPTARWFECWPLSCLPTPLSPCKLYLSKCLFPFIKPSVPVSRRKSALLKTRTMLSYVAVFCPFFWPKLLLLMVLGLIIKLNKTKENPLLSQRPSFVCRHSLQLKSYSIELPLTYEYTYLIQIYAFVNFVGPVVETEVWLMPDNALLLNYVLNILSALLFFLFSCVFWDRISINCSDWLQTNFTSQSDLGLTIFLPLPVKYLGC